MKLFLMKFSTLFLTGKHIMPAVNQRYLIKFGELIDKNKVGFFGSVFKLYKLRNAKFSTANPSSSSKLIFKSFEYSITISHPSA